MECSREKDASREIRNNWREKIVVGGGGGVEWSGGIGAWCASRIRPERRGYYSTWARNSASKEESVNEQMADVNTILHGL